MLSVGQGHDRKSVIKKNCKSQTYIYVIVKLKVVGYLLNRELLLFFFTFMNFSNAKYMPYVRDQ